MVLLLSLSMLVAACGGDDDSGVKSTGVTTTSAIAVTEPISTTAVDDLATEPAPTESVDPPTATLASTVQTTTAADTPTTRIRATATTEPTADAEPTVTVAATEAPETQSADVQSDQLVIEPVTDGALFYGQVINRGNAPATRVRVMVTVYNAAGNVLASSAHATAMMLPVIPAGGISPYAGRLRDFDASRIADHTINVEYQEFDPGTQWSFTTDTVEVTQIQWTTDRISGEVRNTGEEALTSATVLVAGYGDDGTIVHVQMFTVNEGDLQPGATWPFDDVAFGIDDPPASFEGFAYGHR